MLQREPVITDRSPQPYVGVRELVTMDSFDRIADRLPELIGWLHERGIVIAGAPFFRYVTIDMDRGLDVEAGVPVGQQVEVTGDVFARSLPGGRFVTYSHRGHPDGLLDATRDLLAWASEHDLRWDVRDTPVGERWGCRLEVSRTDPREQPDMDQWETDLVFRLADDDPSRGGSTKS